MALIPDFDPPSAVTAPTATPVNTPAAWLTINSLRALAMDAVEAANSGHPGTPMALAPEMPQAQRPMHAPMILRDVPLAVKRG